MKSKILITALVCSNLVALVCEDAYCKAETVSKKSQTVEQYQKKKTTFKEAVAAALKNSSSYAISKIDNITAELGQTNAFAVIAPNIEIVANATKERHNLAYDLDNDNLNRERSNRNGDVSVEGVLTQNLFHSFTTTNNYKSKKAAAMSAQWRLTGDTSGLIYSVAESMINLWFAHEDAKSARMKMENLAKELEAQNSSFAAGASTKYDVAKARASYEQARYEADLAELSIKSAEAEFTRLTGLTPTDDIEIPNVEGIAIPKTQEELEKIALRNNPGILQAKFAEQSANYELNVARGRLGPRVDLTARVNMMHHVGVENESTRNESQNKYRRHGGSIGIQVVVPVLSSNESSGNQYCMIAMANEAAKKAAYQVKDTMNTIKKECRVSFNNYESAMSMIKASESAVTSANIGAEGDRQESALGLKSNTDTLVRENQLYDSRKSLANSRARLVLAKFAMLRLMGKLDLKSVGIK